METSSSFASMCERSFCMTHAKWLGVAVSILALGCAKEPMKEPAMHLETHADTVAMMAYEATGSPNAWESVRFIRFDFAVEVDGQRGLSNRHLWDRATGDYRLEWPVGPDTTVVALFNVSSRTGTVFMNGDPVGAEAADQLVAAAYRRHINDTYWLMAPHKLFDPGVLRTYMPDSSSASAEVLHLSFDNVGLTPGDQYWMKVDPASGEMMEWTYVLQGPNHWRGTYRWVDYRTLETPTGTIRLSERKEAVGGGRAILTDHVALPEAVPTEVFVNPAVAMD